MSTLSSELKGVIESRLRAASPREVLVIASALCDEETGAMPIKPIANGVEARFTVHGDIVYDAKTGLNWSRNTLAGGRRNWADAKKAAEECRLGGFSDWRLPTIQELLSIVDYSRSEPAIDISVFECESAWYWTSTPAASSPSGYAWGVDFDGGGSGWYGDGCSGFVRAVRPGQ